jgi:hypothetical protein
MCTESVKVEAVKNWKTPKSPTEVRSFCGLVSYYRKFIPNFGHIARPLYKLTEKGNAFVWDDDCELAFQTLKRKLCEAPILAYPNCHDTFVPDTGASSAYGIGGVLAQIQQDEEKVIAYGSRTLTKCERNYCMTRRELLAIVNFVKQFKHYLYYGKEFIVRSDHSAFEMVTEKTSLAATMVRWC